MFAIAQVFGLLGVLFWSLSIQQKSQSKILFMQLLANSFYGIQYLLLSAYSGAALYAVACVRTFLFYERRKNNKKIPISWLFFFLGLTIISAILTYDGLISLFPSVIVIFYTIFIYMEDPIWIKSSFLFVPFIETTYNLLVHAYVAILGSLLEFVSGVIAVIKDKSSLKNSYSLPFKEEFYVEFGGINKKDSHSWDIPSQRYAYDFEIRDKQNLPFHDDYLVLDNYYSYKKDIIAPMDGVVVEICNKYPDTKIVKDRKIVCDVDDVRGNHIIIMHGHNEYSMIAHILKDSFKVKEGDYVKRGQELAKIGNSGNTNGPHIHFQVQKGDGQLAPGIPIHFQNVVKTVHNHPCYAKYLKHGMLVKNK